MDLREYQLEAVNALWSNADKNCVISLPTGAGKSLVLSELIRRAVKYEGTHVLILQHKRELLKQNAKHIAMLLPLFVQVGVYCAGLREKNQAQVTLATIQSIANAKDLLPFEIIICDECHLVPKSGQGQYRTLFARLPQARIWGLSATPYRLDGGLLYTGEDRLFDHLACEVKTGDLIKQGFLSPIRARTTSGQADLSDVHIRGGEFKPDEMQAAMDHAELTAMAVKDVLTHATDRKSILVFAAGIEHAKHVEAAFRAAGQLAIATVTEETSSANRDAILSSFRSGSLRIVVNVGVLHTGYDGPGIDCIVCLRATQSCGWWVQALGRGLRKDPNNPNKVCLLLDYTDGVRRFGPLDEITAQRATGKQVAAPIRTCPECQTIQFAGRKTCESCGYIFPREERKAPVHGTEASDDDPIDRPPAKIEEHEVRNVTYENVVTKAGNKAMRCDYHVGIYEVFSEWVMPEKMGFPMEKAQGWFARRGISPMPRTVEDACICAERCLWPKRIWVKSGGASKYKEIVKYGDWQKPDETPAVKEAPAASDDKWDYEKDVDSNMPF